MRKNVILICAALVFAAAPGIHAQVTEEWVARYNGPADSIDVAEAIVLDVSGNVYVTGESEGLVTDRDYATIKYNSSGVEQWVDRYEDRDSGNDAAYDLAIDGSGNVYVTGKSEDASETHDDYVTIKYDPSGTRQWVVRFDGRTSEDDEAYAVAVDDAGNVYVTGRSFHSETSFDYATVKYNSSGVQQWVSRYDGPASGWDGAEAIALDDAGNVYVTGRSPGSGTSGDYATIKYNSSGAEQWVARYDGTYGVDWAWAIALDGEANVYVTGKSYGSGGDLDYATVKYNSSGVEQWVCRYDGPANDDDGANAIALDGEANVYVAGESQGSGSNRDYATIKYNTSGVEQWVARYDGPANVSDGANAIALDDAGNVYVTGRSVGSGTHGDYATIKYNSSGVEQWAARYDGPASGYDCANAIALDDAYNVYVTGFSEGSGTLTDYVTIKYSQATGVAEELEPSSLMVFASLNRLRYNLPGSVTGLLSVYSADGQKVVSETVEGTGIWEAPAGLSQGVYFCRMQASAFNDTKKLILFR